MLHYLTIFFFAIFSLLRANEVLIAKIAMYVAIAAILAKLILRDSRWYSSSEIESLDKAALNKAIDKLIRLSRRGCAVVLLGVVAEIG